MLSGKQKRFLRAEAHGLEPTVMIGKEGLSDTLLEAVREALLAHELIKVRVLDTAPVERHDAAEQLPPLVEPRRAAQPTARTAYFGAAHGSLMTPVVDRGDLDRTARSGPLIVEEYDATTVVPPGWSVRLDEHANIRLAGGGA